MQSTAGSGPDYHQLGNRSERRSAGGQGGVAGKIGSLVWLTGVRCAPTRLPLALAFSCRNFLRNMRNMSSPKQPDFAIFGLLFGSIACVYLTLLCLQTVYPLGDSSDRHWLISLVFNVLGYSTVFLPGYLIFKYVRDTNFRDIQPPTCLRPVIKLFYFGSEETIDDAIETEQSKEAAAKRPKSDWQVGVTLAICFVGLQVSFLTWGLLQEKIMTREYTNTAGERGKFRDSQFLVFVNRILAFGIATLYITVVQQPRHRAPLYKYSFCSLSNIMSSWFQYEALKFVSFPTQVLAKASKIIPVMLMGKVVSKTTYELYEYVVAVLISFGMVLFLFGSQEDRTDSSPNTTFSGVILLVGYMVSDSFTSNWQGEIFSTYKMTSVQMMCGVNLFSCLLTSSSLLQQGTFYTSLVFMSQFPSFTFDCVVLSICSAVGQLFIYFTISEFGPVAFIIIMTLRQALAILLSCVFYNHAISLLGVLGVLVVFGAMFLKIYCGWKRKKAKQAAAKAVAGSPTKA